MASRYYSQFPEKKLGENPRYGDKDGKPSKSTKGSRSEKGESALKDTEPGYENYGPERKYSLNRSTKWPIIKTVVEADGVDL